MGEKEHYEKHAAELAEAEKFRGPEAAEKVVKDYLKEQQSRVTQAPPSSRERSVRLGLHNEKPSEEKNADIPTDSQTQLDQADHEGPKEKGRFTSFLERFGVRIKSPEERDEIRYKKEMGRLHDERVKAEMRARNPKPK